MLNLNLMAPSGGGEPAQTAYEGSRYYRTDSGVFLKDFGHGDSKDDAKLYSGQALDFDGVDDYVDTSAVLVDGDSYTIVATIHNNLTAGSDGTRVILNSWWGQNGFCTLSGRHFEFLVGSADYNDGIKLRLNQWFPTDTVRIALVVKNGGSASIYVDGVDKTADAVMDNGVNANINTAKLTGRVFRLGANTKGTVGYSPNDCFDGQISNAQIWNAAFTADDVAYDYANLHHMLTANNNPDSDLTSENLKGWWPLIEGSGDTAYDWSGNGNHGTIELGTQGNTSYDNAWGNADALDSPLVPQTALLEWGLKTSNNACVPLDTADSTNFTRDYSELNLNGRSFPAGLAGADVVGAMTATVEMVVNIDDVTDLQYLIDGQKDSGTGYIKQTAGTIDASSGTVYVNNSATTTIASGLCHVVVSGISLNASELFIGRKNDSTGILLGQLPMCKIYEETWDAAKVDTYYQKATAKYNL